MTGGRRLAVWDAPTRLFHWLLAALVAAAYATWRLNWMIWHAWVGEGLLALVLFRIAWGFVGGETARFARFVVSPRRVAEHLKHALVREPDRQVGHNPAGGWMVLILLALVLAEALTGIYINNDIADEGPLTELVSARMADAIDTAHAAVWDVLLAAIALHVAAIAFYAAVKGQNLLRPMVTGGKVLPLNTPAPRLGSQASAAALLLASVAAAIAIARWL